MAQLVERLNTGKPGARLTRVRFPGAASFFLSFLSVSLSLSVCLCLSLSLCRPDYLIDYLPTYLPTYLSTYLPTYLLN